MNKTVWTTLGLTKKQLCFFDEISKKARFSGGRKLSRTAILRAILSTAQKLEIKVEGVRSEGDLKERALEAFRRGD